MIDISYIYRPEWERIYSYLLETTALCGVLLFPFVMFLVIFKSPSTMRVYKWMIVNSLVWSFLLDLLLSLYKPYPLLPFYQGKFCL